MYVYVCAEENIFLNCCSIIYFVSGDRPLKSNIDDQNVLSQVNKLPITSIDLCYIVTKKPLHE